ncbi:putative aspartokinase [Candidatus Nitrosocosmicus franklandus]|uniref:Aspartokinase n=2 Tax=Candidatus Nitrosocosmicus franklandianus TaxID=1798806 RepID=A0A484IAG8_9ARCH|nr:putative aspartokinase [Candidatus Nitrosocosmicus franklandus]
MRIIMKFGGSVLDSPQRIKKIVEIVKSFRINKNTPEIICVISAMYGVTDKIIALSDSLVKSDKRAIKKFIDEMTLVHIELVEGAITNPKLRQQAKNAVLEVMSEFQAVLEGLVLIAEVTPRSLDHILSFGERLMAPIVSYSLKDQDLNSDYFTGKQIGIVTDSNFGEASPLMDTTKFRVNARLVPILQKNIIPVVTGYIAADQHDHVTTLGRSGSDYTATIIAFCINADVVYLWSDVDGLMTADPSIVNGAQVLSEISYNEAAEMVLFGAKYIHPRALEPVMDSNIPIIIRNALNLINPGTTITPVLKVSTNIVKSIISIRNTALIDVGGGGMVGAPGTAASIFQTLAKNKVNIMMISQGPSESSISMILKQDDLGKAITSLELKLLGRVIKHLNVLENVSIVTVVGSGMRGIKGIAGRIFTSIAKNDINVIMIAQGSSELNLAFVVNDDDCEKAVRTLHHEFGLDKVQ